MKSSKQFLSMLIGAAALIGAFGSGEAAEGFKLCAVRNESPLVMIRDAGTCDPFCPEKCLTFRLERPSFTMVRVETPMGLVVRELTAQVLPAGDHVISWDGRNDRGECVDDGVYLYTLRTLPLISENGPLALGK